MRLQLRCVCGASIDVEFVADRMASTQSDPLQFIEFKDQHKNCLNLYWENQKIYRDWQMKPSIPTGMQEKR